MLQSHFEHAALTRFLAEPELANVEGRVLLLSRFGRCREVSDGWRWVREGFGVGLGVGLGYGSGLWFT